MFTTRTAKMLPKYVAESRSSTIITLGVWYSAAAIRIDLITANTQTTV